MKPINLYDDRVCVRFRRVRALLAKRTRRENFETNEEIIFVPPPIVSKFVLFG